MGLTYHESSRYQQLAAAIQAGAAGRHGLALGHHDVVEHHHLAVAIQASAAGHCGVAHAHGAYWPACARHAASVSRWASINRRHVTVARMAS